MSTLPFDRIETKQTGAWASLTLEEWRTLDAVKQVDLIIAGEVRFLSLGKPIKTTDALESPRKLN